MRIAALVVLCFAVAAGVASQAFEDKQTSADKRTAVLVELFTSEGCSSCPPVDKLVADLETRQPVANAEVVLLSFHVDYWDQLGWKDRFSSHDYTLRQQHYSALFSEPEVYTPELIVDGRESRPESLAQQIGNAASATKAVELQLTTKAARSVTISAHGDAKASARVLVAITEDGLSTKVVGGENGGHTLTHSGVVRSLTTLGKLEKGTLNKDFTLALDPQWQTAKLTLVAFAQDEKTGHVLGVKAEPVSALLK